MKELKDKKIWERARKDPRYRPLLDMLDSGYDEFCRDRDIPVIRFSDEMEFINEGTRTRFEKKYFLRRKQLTVYTLMTLIYPENAEYLKNLEDIICEICNEYSWQVPAHRPPENPNRRDGIALFSAETGFYLAEIKQILGDRLDPLVTDRITAELDRRILTSFENELTGIEIKSVTNNWASVLGCCIGLTFMYESPERFEKIYNRIERHTELYLEGISDDGATYEGASYWNYGFCFYVMYYDTLRSYMNGRGAEAFKKEKVKKAAGFFSALVMDENNLVSFADSSSNDGYNMWLLHFLKREYGIDMPPASMAELPFNKVSCVLRAFLYYDPEHTAEPLSPGEAYFENQQIYICRKKNYAFAVNGGINDPEDNHNHNDIGSFIVVQDGKQMFCDLGSPVYTADNFGATRYKVINNSSLGHGVPIINGHEQSLGADCIGPLTVGDKITVDMKKVYPDALQKLTRSFTLSENSICVLDEFDCGLDITERFLTEETPVASEDGIILGNARITYPEGWTVSYTERDFTAHDGVTVKHIYFMDFKSKAPCDSFKLDINFKE